MEKTDGTAGMSRGVEDSKAVNYVSILQRAGRDWNLRRAEVGGKRQCGVGKEREVELTDVDFRTGEVCDFVCMDGVVEVSVR